MEEHKMSRNERIENNVHEGTQAVAEDRKHDTNLMKQLLACPLVRHTCSAAGAGGGEFAAQGRLWRLWVVAWWWQHVGQHQGHQLVQSSFPAISR